MFLHDIEPTNIVRYLHSTIQIAGNIQSEMQWCVYSYYTAWSGTAIYHWITSENSCWLNTKNGFIILKQ